MLTITDNAVSFFNSVTEKENKKYVRLSIESGGCNGFSKAFSTTNENSDDDTIFNDVLIIDEISLSIINGSKVDYKTDLTGNYVSVEVPHASTNCGCGTSFSI